MITDNNQFDNKVNATLLPVRAAFKTPEKLPVLCSLLVTMGDENKATLWCGTKNEMLLLMDIYTFQVTYCRKLYNRSRYDTSLEYCVTAIAKCEVDDSTTYVWAITQPNNVLVCWDARKETQLNKVNIEQFTTEPGKERGTIIPLNLSSKACFAWGVKIIVCSPGYLCTYYV